MHGQVKLRLARRKLVFPSSCRARSMAKLSQSNATAAPLPESLQQLPMKMRKKRPTTRNFWLGFVHIRRSVCSPVRPIRISSTQVGGKVPFIIDASIALAWILPDENDYRPLHLLDQLNSEAGLAPAHWHAEIANGLLMAERRRRIVPADTARFMDYLLGLNIVIDPSSGKESCVALISLAREHGLTVYDAIYLDLAMRSGLSLATLDQQLSRAAELVGVEKLQ